LLSKLNPPQREAVRYLDGPLLVLAGAGSGKTRVITHKIAYLVRECGFDPGHIAAITFTNKAAREMRERSARLLAGKSLAALNVSTFHALGARILRQEAAKVGLKPGFSILDAADAASVAAELARETDKGRLRAILAIISRWKNALAGPEQAAKAAGDEIEKAAAQVYPAYERALRAYQAVDFDDLIRLPATLFQEHPEALARWQGRLRYLLVDEYQDTNRSQYLLMRLLAGPRSAFTAVGDDDQAIYSWRGADVENLRSLGRDYPALRVVKLEQNYRSTTRILAAANSLIANNPKLFEKRLWSELGHGEPIDVAEARDPEHEAESVVMKLAAHRFERRGRYGDYAILYRGNHQARAFEQQLRQQRIPYVISGGQSFFERGEIKDLNAYLRLIANRDDDPAFIRAVTTPRRGVGAQTLEALGRYAGSRHVGLFVAALEAGAATQVPQKQLDALHAFCRFVERMESRAHQAPAREVLDELLRAVGYEAFLFESLEAREAESKWGNVRDYADWLGRKGEEDGKSLIELSQTVALLSMLDKDQADADAVQLATLHAAKGLEFDHVFLVGVEEGLLPHRESIEGGAVEEERRLMYVGVTRARRSLSISYCARRPSGREIRPCEPSRFLAELGGDLRRSGSREAVADRSSGSARLAALKALLGAGTTTG